MSRVEGPPDPPLPVQVGLGLLAARLDRSAGPGLLVARDRALRAASQLWVGAGDPALETPGDYRDGPVQRLLWLFPRRDDDLAAVAQHLGPGGRVGVLGRGWLAPLFDRFRPALPAGAAVTALAGALPAAGLLVESSWTIGRPSSPVLAALARLADRGGRLDLVDRLSFRYRRSLAPRDGLRIGDLVALVARRPP